jgi:RimJ/RimL family protein N-acetyltransferase
MGPFETDRLLLRPYQTGDVDALRRLIYEDEAVWRMYSSLGGKPEELAARFVYHCHQPAGSPFGRLAVLLKATDEVVGQVHLDPYVNDFGAVPGDAPSPFASIEVELAFAFGRLYWGQGLAYEACRALIDYAFLTLKLPRLVGSAMKQNERSVRLHQRLGFEIYPSGPPDDPKAGWVTVLKNDRLGACSADL